MSQPQRGQVIRVVFSPASIKVTNDQPAAVTVRAHSPQNTHDVIAESARTLL